MFYTLNIFYIYKLFFQSFYGEIKWNSEFENLAVDLTYKWKDTATCLNLILDHFHDGILDKAFYRSIAGIPLFKVIKNKIVYIIYLFKF